MEITKAKCESILNTLPIGFYAGRRVNVRMDEKENTSYYSPLEDTIVVSFPIIAERMKHVSSGVNEEQAVRSMLYHEVSHAILTPPTMTATNWMNIMEDERIESVLRNYYHGVDFKKQLYDLHDGKIPPATNAIQAFFNAVRFGVAPASILKEVNTILKRYKDINRSTAYYRDYYSDTSRLYEKISRLFKKSPEEFQPSADMKGSSEQKQMDSMKQKSGSDKGEQKEGQGGSDGQEDSENNNESESSRSSSKSRSKDKPDDTTPQGESEREMPLNNIIGDEERHIYTDIDKLKQIFAEAFDKYSNMPEEYRKQLEEFRRTVETIISNFNKKNSGGMGVNAYSGVFNPRAVVRKDYRFFERSMSTQGNNKFGTCHLNLFIDCSGSFWASEKLVNGIITVLTDIERKNRNFSIDISFINHEYFDCKELKDRHFRTWGGNEVPADMKERFLKRQLPNTCNYNIVLFDGDAFSDTDSHDIEESKRRFSSFDFKQTTMITDRENQRYLGSGFHNTKVIVTSDYTKELITHITKALTVAFG